MSPFSLLLLVGTCSAFFDFAESHDGVVSWPSLTSVFPSLLRSTFPRSPNSLFFHNSALDFPTRPVLLPQPTFSRNRHNSGAHSGFPFKNLVSPRPFPPFHIVRPAFTPNLLSRNNQDLDFFNHEVDHVRNIISPLLNFFNSYLDSSIDFVLSIEGASPEDDDLAIGTEKLDSSLEEDTSQQNVNLNDILDEIFEGYNIKMMDPNVDKDFGSPNFNLTKDMEEDYEAEVIDTAVIENARLPHTQFDDILEEIFESPENDDSDIGTSMEEDGSQLNVNLDNILEESFEGDDIEMMDPNVEKDVGTPNFNLTKDMEEDYEEAVIDTAAIENDRSPHTIPHYNILFHCPYSLSELEEIFESDNNEMLDSKDSTIEKDKDPQNFSTPNYTKEDYENEVINRTVIEHNDLPHINADDVLNEIPENYDNEMLYTNVEKHSDLENSNLTKDVKGDYEDQVIDPKPEIDFENEIKNTRQNQDESSDSTGENIDHAFEPTIILIR